MWDRLTERSRDILQQAVRETVSHHQAVVTPEHLLLALLKGEDTPPCFLARLLATVDVSREVVARELENRLPCEEVRVEGSLSADARLQALIAPAQEEAQTLKCLHVAPEHLFLALYTVEGIAAETLLQHFPEREQMRQALEDLYGVSLSLPRVEPDGAIEETIQAPSMYARYTDAAKQAIYYAQREAQQLGSSEVEPEHLLAGVLQDEGTTATRILNELGLDRNTVREALSAEFKEGPGQREISDLRLSQRSGCVIHEAHRQMNIHKDTHVGTEHLLLGLVYDKGTAGAVLARHRLSVNQEGKVGAVVRQMERGPAQEGGTHYQQAAPPKWGRKHILLFVLVLAGMFVIAWLGGLLAAWWFHLKI
jgi:ATP-dependent Clp protease ATP-binding subunit ClpA